MNGAATTAEWLACSGIGVGSSAVVLGLLKLAVDGPPDLEVLRHRPAPTKPRPASERQPRHAAPPVDETQPIACVQPARARHAKKAA